MDVSVLLLMLMVLSTNADSKDNHCVDVSHNGREKKFQVSCEEEGAVISNITVFSGTNNCPGNAGCCVGETPNLIVESLNCYWVHNCSISFPRDIIIKSYSECQNCIGNHPNFMLITETRCFTPKNKTDGHVEQGKIDICENLTTGDDKSSMSVDSGLLLSHKNYPWEYEPSKIMTPREPNKTCHKKLWLEADTKIVVSVHTIDVAEGDSLLIITDSTIKDIRDKTTLVYYDYQTKSVEFNFTVAQESNGGMGFIVCFKRIPTRDNNPIMNACDDVMNQSAAVKVTEADAECTRTWWGCPTPSPKKGKKKCTKAERRANKCRRRKKKGQKKNKKNRERRKKKDKEKKSKSLKRRRSRKQARDKSV